MTKKNLETYLIAYPLFCNSKKFSLRNYLINNNLASYKDFRKFLISKSVQPPREEYFNLVKLSLEKDMTKYNKEDTLKNEVNISNNNTKKRTYKKRNQKIIEKNTDE